MAKRKLPKRVRNFWLEVEIDGREHRVNIGGPNGSDGGFKLHIYMRRDGKPFKAMEVTGQAIEDNCLHLAAVDSEILDFVTVDCER